MGMMEEARAGADLFAKFETTEGTITVKLFAKDAPKTVENFVGLATGEKQWVDPATGETKKNVSLYNGTIFHRCIKEFMVQGGDPLGRGTGGPGYKFEDEFQSGRRFDKPGLLAMANAGPNTNGSQFFIVTIPSADWLNGKHTVFGEVTDGMEVVDAIEGTQTDGRDMPLDPQVIESVELA